MVDRLGDGVGVVHCFALHDMICALVYNHIFPGFLRFYSMRMDGWVHAVVYWSFVGIDGWLRWVERE